MIKMYLKPLAKCELNDGILTVPGLKPVDYIRLAKELRDAIIDYKVPHWKIVAIHIKLGNSSQFEDFITKPEGIDKSYAELLPVFKKVVAAEGGGEPVIVKIKSGNDANCFYKKPGDMSFIADTEDIVNTYDGHITYESFPSKSVEFLKDVDILEAENGTVQAIMYRGTGCIEFSDAMEIIESYNTNSAVCSAGVDKVTYCPMTAVYDLAQFVNVKLPSENDMCVKLLYKSKINEEVLHKILVQFGNDMIGG